MEPPRATILETFVTSSLPKLKIKKNTCKFEGFSLGGPWQASKVQEIRAFSIILKQKWPNTRGIRQIDRPGAFRTRKTRQIELPGAFQTRKIREIEPDT